MMNVQTLADEAALAALIPEWERLDASLSPRTPFTSPLWCLTWWRQFRRDTLRVHDEMRVFAVRDEAGDLVGVAPMMLTRRPAIGPIRTRELQFFGADPYVTELRGPVCRPEQGAAVLAALGRHLGEVERDWDWVQWRGLRRADTDEGSRAGEPPLDQYSELSNYYLDLPPTWEAFRAGLSRNIKESLRKCYNSLARDGHAFELRVVEDPAEAGPALRLFLDLHRARADTTGTVDHIDVFARPEARRFLLDYGRSLAERGELKIFQLVIGGAVIATRIGIVLGQELYLYYSGYDVAWGRYSVMTTTVAEAIRWAVGHGFKVVNLSTGTDVSKMRWRPRQAVFGGGYQVSASVKSRLAYASVDALRRRGRPRPLAAPPPDTTPATALQGRHP